MKLTPEEWVRQNCYQWLIQVLHYPGQLIAIEKEMDLNGRKKRFDLLVYDKQHKPWMLVECKRQELPLNATVLWQAIGYNIAIPVSYFLLSNGVDVRIMSIKGETKKEMDTMPLHE